MDTLPIKLNFFKRAEQFFELRALDKQYNKIMKIWENELKIKKTNPEYSPKFTFPTWNVEKKILFWTYLYHKHLGTPLNEDCFKMESQFLGDWKTDIVEATLAGGTQILQNLEAHGFAKIQTISPVFHQTLINSDGLLAGSILYNNYRSIEKSFSDDEYKWPLLVPIKHKMIGHYMLYAAAWMIILFSMCFISFQVISTLGLLSSIRDWFTSISSQWHIVFDIFLMLPPILLIVGSLLIMIGRKKVIK